MIKIDDGCISCGICLSACPLSLFQKGETQYEVIHPERCMGCGHCVGVCPEGVITHQKISREISFSILDGKKEALDGLLDRRSIRKFKDKEVSDQLIRELVHLGAQTPAAKNQRGFKIIALKDSEKQKRLLNWIGETYQGWVDLAKHPVKKHIMRAMIGKRAFLQFQKTLPMFERLAVAIQAGKDPIFYNAPVILIICGQRGNFKRDDAAYLVGDLGHFATLYGLGSCIIGFAQAIFDRGVTPPADILALKKGETIFQTMIVGYPGLNYSNQFLREAYPVEII